MEMVLSFFQQNSGWLFGGGGIAAALIAILKFARRDDGSAKPIRVTSGGNTTISHNVFNNRGLPINIALGASLVIAIIGGALLILPSAITIDNSRQDARSSQSGTSIAVGKDSTVTIAK